LQNIGAFHDYILWNYPVVLNEGTFFLST